MQKYLVAVLLLLCGVTALHAAQAAVPAATEAPPPGLQPTVSAKDQAAKCVKQFIDCVTNMGSKLDSHEIMEARVGKAWNACATAGNLCADSIPKPPEPVAQKDDCNVVPSSAQAGKAIQSYMQSGSALPGDILKMQQMQKNAFDLEISLV